MTQYIVIYTDLGSTTDGLARKLGTFDSRSDAVRAMNEDVDEFLENNLCLEITDYDTLHTWVGDEDNGCLWQILEV